MKTKLIAAAVATVLVLTACSGETKTDAPEPTPENIVNGTNTQVIRMPDGFRNVAFTCYGTTGIYVTSRGWLQSQSTDVVSLPSSITVLDKDPHCGR